MARTLIVDDSLFVRTVLTRIVAEEGHEVVGLAANGEEGVRLAARLKPDLILMDIVMGEMNGIEATRKIMRLAPTRILVLSSLTTIGRRETIEALRAGAVDFLLKPDAAHMYQLREELAEKIRTVLAAHPRGSFVSPGDSDGRNSAKSASDIKVIPSQGPARQETSDRATPSIVAIGVSTGGPSTLGRILTTLPVEFPIPILVAQHMPPGWTLTLAEQLAAECVVAVTEARNLEEPRPGHVYIAPGGSTLCLTRQGRLKITQDTSRRGFRPSVDLLLESVAASVAKRALGIILTGMGDDGREGAAAIREAGGTIIAQDEASSIIFGMPRAVIEAGLASSVLSLDEIAAYLRNLVV